MSPTKSKLAAARKRAKALFGDSARICFNAGVFNGDLVHAYVSRGNATGWELSAYGQDEACALVALCTKMKAIAS